LNVFKKRIKTAIIAVTNFISNRRKNGKKRKMPLFQEKCIICNIQTEPSSLTWGSRMPRRRPAMIV